MARLRKANRVSADAAPSPNDPQARALMERIIATPPEMPPERDRWRWVRSRRGLTILVPVLVVALAAGGYGIYRAVSEPLVIACYQGPSLGADVAALPATGADPASRCRTLWKPGGLFNPGGQTPVPPLMVCLQHGAFAVVPHQLGSDICKALRLPRPENTALNAEQLAAIRVKDSLELAYGPHCVSRPQAVTTARGALDHEGLRDWAVVVTSPFTSARPCASLAVDVEGRAVLIVPNRSVAP